MNTHFIPRAKITSPINCTVGTAHVEPTIVREITIQDVMRHHRNSICARVLSRMPRDAQARALYRYKEMVS